jgi:hypothetical protein
MLSETRRRLIGNLSEPRSLPNLTRVLRADAHGPFDERVAFEESRADIERELERALLDGQVIEVGSYSAGTAAVRAVQEHDLTIDIPEGKAERLVERLDSPRDSRLDTGVLYVLSKAGFDALHAPLTPEG